MWASESLRSLSLPLPAVIRELLGAVAIPKKVAECNL